MDAETLAKVAELRKLGVSVALVAKRLDLSLADLNLEIRAMKIRSGTSDFQGRQLRAVELAREGLPQQEVAEALGVSQTTVSHAIKLWEMITGEKIAHAPIEDTKHRGDCDCRSCVRGREIDAEIRLRRRIGFLNKPSLEDYVYKRVSTDYCFPDGGDDISAREGRATRKETLSADGAK